METKAKSNPIFRFKFNDSVVELIHGFAKLHQFDDRHTFKEAWERWSEANYEQLSLEEKRLKDLGYSGNMYDKMYKSARYYFRKKEDIRPKPKERKKYIGLDRDVLNNMDNHIQQGDCSESPAQSFQSYCLENGELIKREATRLLQTSDLTPQEITHKFKKTYKNRYFQMK